MRIFLVTLLYFSLLSQSVFAAEQKPEASKKVTVEIKTTVGIIKIELNRVKAPKTVDNFLKYVSSDFYNGTVFHRVIKGFMIQGGGFNLVKNKLIKKSTNPPIKNEARNGLSNRRGTIAMSRLNKPHTATAQFYINHKDNRNLNFVAGGRWGYTVFGKVVSGLKIVDKIAQVSTKNMENFNDVPVKAIKILSIRKL